MTPKKLKAAAIGGGAAGIASQIPIVNCLCCALVIGGGLLAVYLAMRNEPATDTAPYGDGAMVGVLAGVAAAIVGLLVSIPMTMIMGDPMELARSILEGFEGMPPEVLEGFAGAEAPSMAGLGVIAFLFSLVFNVIFSAIGGVIGAGVFHKKPSA